MQDEIQTPDSTDTTADAPIVQGTGSTDVKDIDAVDDDHPLVQQTGRKVLEKRAENGAAEFLSDFIYEQDSAFVREWLQNHETACVRAAKLLIRLSDEYPEGWLKIEKRLNEEGEVADEDADPSDVRVVEFPRPIEQVIEAARNLGYDPTITWDVYRDERKLVTEDNGIGMTPYEFDKAFNTMFNSGSGVDGETGGMFGVGSESSALVHGKNGGMEVMTQSRRPGSGDGFMAYSYLGGANPLPGEVNDDFRGTRFNIPVQEQFNIDKLHDWIEDYTEHLRVPVLLQIHDTGHTPIEEEYPASPFLGEYDDPPVVIDRPGEFSLVGGPDVYETGYHVDDENTYLVSMPIDRNHRSAFYSSKWDVVIQIHDEQGRIVAGPNRGRYTDGAIVFESSDKAAEVGQLHDDDIVLPQPTGSRDTLQKDSLSKSFFEYADDLVVAEELNQLSTIADRLQQEPVGEVFIGNESGWKLFEKLVTYHGPYDPTSLSNLKTFLNDSEHFPDYDDATIVEIKDLFKEIEYCHRGKKSVLKSKRREKQLGEFIAKYGNREIYMAASTGGNFKQYMDVAKNTHFNPEFIVIPSSSRYDEYKSRFGFKKLVDVPLLQDDDHDYDVPDSIHEDNKKKTFSSGSGGGETTIKLRTDADSSDVDMRLSLQTMKEDLDNGREFGHHKKVILFRRGKSTMNISDNYNMAEYAAIACVKKSVFEELHKHERVMTPAEFRDWSGSQLIATTDGAMTPAELIADDRMVVMGYDSRNEALDLLADDMSALRRFILEDVRDQMNWSSRLDDYDLTDDVDDSDKPDMLYAVADGTVLKRAKFAFETLKFDRTSLVGLLLNGMGYSNYPCRWRSPTKSVTKYRFMRDTPNWDNDSKVYGKFYSDTPRENKFKEQMYMVCHDHGIDPTEMSPTEIRDELTGDD